MLLPLGLLFLVDDGAAQQAHVQQRRLVLGALVALQTGTDGVEENNKSCVELIYS